MPDFPKDVIPDKGVIRDHIDLIYPPGQEPLIEAPVQFVYASILSAIGTVIGKKAWVPWFGGKNLYCNTYILLIGESTLTRKTTCINYCNGYLCDICVADPSIQPFIFPSAGSPEGIFEELARNGQGTFLFSEFSSLTDLLEKKYASDLKGFLTDIFDCGYPISKKLTGRTLIVQNYYPNLFAGTATDWFEKASNSKDFRSGWYTRFLFIWGEDTGIEIPFPKPNSSGKRMKIVKDLIDIHKMSPGEMKMTVEARSKYEEWYSKNRKIEDTLIKTMNVRLFDYCIKISMINALSEKRAMISLEDISRSIVFVEWLMNNNAKLMEEYISFNQWDAEIKKIRKRIIYEGEMSRRDIMRALHLNHRQVSVIIETLLERGDIEEFVKKPSGAGRPSKVYRPSPIVNLKWGSTFSPLTVDDAYDVLKNEDEKDEFSTD